jgi:hypothetical protein
MKEYVFALENLASAAQEPVKYMIRIYR